MCSYCKEICEANKEINYQQSAGVLFFLSYHFKVFDFDIR